MPVKRKETRIVAIGTFKGGVGKTMSTFQIAGILEEMGYKVLLMDCDPQGNLTTRANVQKAVKGFKGMEQILGERTGVTFDEVIKRSPINGCPNIDIIPSSIMLHACEVTLFKEARPYEKLAKFMRDNKAAIDEYDYILIDTAPSMGLISQNAFVVADKIIMPATADIDDLEGINLFCAIWDRQRERLELKDNIANVFISKLDLRDGLDRDFVEFISKSKKYEDVSSMLMDTKIPKNTKLRDSTIAKQPINIFSKASRGCIAYKALVEELFEKEVL